MTIAAYRYKYADWESRVMMLKPEWHYTGHNCKGDLPPDATIEPMYSQAYVQELVQRCERMAAHIEYEATCPCCTESKTCLEGCTFETDSPMGHQKMSAARMALYSKNP